MKVLSVSHLFPNNMNPNKGVFVKERLKYIAQKIDLRVIAPVPYFPFSHKMVRYKNINQVKREETIDNLRVSHPKYFTIPKYFKFLDGYFYYWSLRMAYERLINVNEIDLLDFHWVYPDSFAGIKWAKRFNKKIVVTVRGNESICYFENSLRKKIAISTLKKSDYIISVSNDLKNKMVNEYNINPNKVVVIPNGIDSDKFHMIERDEAQKLCNLEPGKYILSLCNLSPEKGLENLLTAFSMLNHKDVVLLVVGEGVLRPKLERMAQELSIMNNIRFIGAVNHQETITWYNAAYVYCLPSLWEGCPNSIIESLACGTPVVSTMVGGIPDLVSNEDYGILVPPGDASSLLKALNRALSQSWDRVSIARYGNQNSWENVADRVIDIYKEVLK